MRFEGFDKRLVRFLGQLERNNNRQWFEQNKARYEQEVREPVLAFIRAIAPKMERISRYILVSDSKVAGSMMRPYRDTRFSSSKLPYKANVGIQFRHGEGEDAHAPGFWMHIEPGEFWLAAGMWKPDAASLTKVRRRIAEFPQEWLAARDDKRFRSVWQIVGDTLKRPPRGFNENHPLIDDLKRKEFLGFRDIGINGLYQDDIVSYVARCYAAAKPLMEFLCRALEIKF